GARGGRLRQPEARQARRPAQSWGAPSVRLGRLLAVLLLPGHGNAERVVEALVAKVKLGEVVEAGLTHGAGERLHGGGLDQDAVVLGDLVAEGAGEELVGELADKSAQAVRLALTRLEAERHPHARRLGPVQEDVAAVDEDVGGAVNRRERVELLVDE